MKKIYSIFAILLLSLSGLVWALPDSNPPLYKIAFYTIDNRQASLDYLHQIRTHLRESKKAENAIQEKWELGFLPTFQELGTPDEKTKLWLNSQFAVDKIVLIKTLGASLQVTSIDVRKETIEYQNQLPESLAKTLLYDFFAYLDKRNLYLALSTFPSGTESPVTVTSLKEKYKSGQNVSFDLEAKEDSYVYVISIQENDNSAEPKLLFPNSVQTKNYIRKGEKITIPGKTNDLSLTYNSGKEKVRIFTSKVPWNQMDLKNSDNKGFYRLSPLALGSAKSLQTVATTGFLGADTQVLELKFEILDTITE